MSGAGNAFVVIDGRGQTISSTTIASLVPSLCNRASLSMKPAEGVLVLNDIGPGTATSTFFNPDGSTGAMCGNGGRCLVRFALDNGATLDARNLFVFSMAGTTYSAGVSDSGVVCVDFPPPVEERDILPNEIPELPLGAKYLDVGSDHVVVDTRLLVTGIITEISTDIRTSTDTVIELAKLPLDEIAIPIRNNAMFTRGTNVNLATIVNRGTIHMRTFERGVEGETGACGTGAISTAIALWRTGEVDDDVTLVPTSGKALRVVIHHRNDVISGVTLCGDAVYDAQPTTFDISTGQYL